MILTQLLSIITKIAGILRMNTPKLPPKVEAIPNNDTSITISNIPEVKTAPSKYEIQLERSIAEVATCLWDINRKLHSSETIQHDRKLRLAQRRAERALLALEEIGIVIDDPIGSRYVAGSEGSMQPNFQPTPSVTFEQVVETITPVVYWNEHLIGRGEVFVAIPIPENQNTESVSVVTNESNLTDTLLTKIDPPSITPPEDINTNAIEKTE